MALPIVLILLVVVTVLGIAGARIALLGERSTRFDRDYQIAWESAEAALVDAEYDIDGPNTSASNRLTTFSIDSTNALNFVSGCGTSAQNQGLCGPSTTASAVWQTIDFVSQSGSQPFVTFGTYTGRVLTNQNGNLIQPFQPPHYIIEEVIDVRAGTAKATGSNGSLVHPVLYRITSIGFGPSLQTQVLMQSIYAKE